MRDGMKALIPAAAAALVVASGCATQKQHAKIERAGEALRVELAETYIDKGAKEAAIPLLRRALAAEPNDPKVRTLYATVLRDLGQYPQAQAHFAHALEIDPGYAPAHAGLGILYDLQRQAAAARPCHERAVTLAPGDAGYRNNLGFSLYLAGDTAGAIAQYEAALSLDPGLMVTYNNLGFAHGRRGDFAAAERSFRAVGSAAAALINLSLVYDEHGDRAHADALREQAYALAPDLRPDEESMR